MTAPLWTPERSRCEQTRMFQFMQQLNRKHNLSLDTYESLHQWSIEHSTAFWSELWDYADVIASQRGSTVLEHPERMPGARWFPEAQLNFAQNLLRYRDEQPAVIFRGEDDTRIELSHAELYRQVAQLASALRKQGVTKGDRVSGFMPNIPATLVGMLATASIGAIWSSCSPDFGINGVLDRFGQVEPKVMLTTDGYRYNGKVLNSLERVQGIADKLNSVETILVIPFIEARPDVSHIPRAVLWDDFVDQDAAEIVFEQLPFDHPLYVMYSSGTTGVPKCIVHSAGGTLLQHLKEHMLHTDVGRDDRLFYYTTCGWMMWNWLVSGLATGCTLILFDGSPFAPQPSVLWDIAEQEKISIFGTSAKYIAALEKAEVKPRESHDLTALKAVLSTGSPLAHESFEYVYRDIKADLQLSSISGGTDIISCFALGCPIRPVYAGELQCRGLGMAVDIFNDDGQPVRGEKGELVCTQPFPSMPIGFWNDPDGRKYHDAYFRQFENIWAHGDYGEITAHDGLIIHGRSDAVLNPGGVRIGTAEIYRQVEKVEGVLESLCIGQPWDNDVRVVLFVRLQDGIELDDMLIKTIRDTIRANTTPRHVPARVIQVSDIPRTISGKIVELAVRKVVMGEEVKNKDALANPEALELFRDLPELQS
ncbi:acetoacetate--CoA ligase [Marinobacterium sediminicola]|uniref:Acetoacetyl-CoA synthetase n=1 Tax=Marinobacterium sediminicola TaxID=518898 RepID=A0ABY1RX97_9GAMM|nr:acetoacetate--CoA ligase [Marinobacterium sediminicola]ULG67820.1 acetoacetate--CoA ligase [Marinobacterium sediminicola]SMR71502.1 acetoacetyl-CoA synthetase [Marinobacterium sediminicola]